MIRPAFIHDVLYVCRHMDPVERAEREAIYGPDFDVDDYAIALYQRGTAHASVGADGLPRYIGGFIPLHAGVYTTWMVHTGRWRSAVREALEVCTRALEALLADAAHRVEIHCSAANTRAHRFYRRLGFERESIQRAYGADGSDFITFVRLRG